VRARLVAVVGTVALCGAGFVVLSKSADVAVREAFTEMQVRLAAQGASSVGKEIQQIDATLRYAAALLARGDAPERVVRIEAHPAAPLVVTSTAGDTIASSPSLDPVAVRSHVHHLDHFGCPECLRMGHKLLRTRVVSGAGLRVSAMVDLPSFYQGTLAGLGAGRRGYAWMVGRDGMILGAPDSAVIGTFVGHDAQGPGIVDAIARAREPSGTAEYLRRSDGEARTRIAAWSAVELPDLDAVVALSADAEELGMIGREPRLLATGVAVLGALMLVVVAGWSWRDERRRRAEIERTAAALIHTERLASIGALSAGIVHELRNPLTYLGGNLQLIRADLPEGLYDDGDPSPIDDCIDAYVRIKGIVEDVRRLSRRDDEDGEVFDLRDALGDAANIARAEIRSHGALEIVASEPAMVRGHRARLTQVFLNLLVNAAQAVGPGGGRIIARIDITEHGVLAEIEDNGPGVAASDVEKIFEDFFTTKPADAGTGLGLSVSRSIVSTHRGGLEVEPRGAVLGGALFRIRLPAA